jgi:mono/diheme cytochrome c family protein
MLKAGRVLLPNIQHRVLVGVSAFVGILLLTGWVAINEPARMEVFTQQYHGRSIENGAQLFLNLCATCHGVDAKGTAGRAPALNNPMLFSKENPAATAQKQIDVLKTQQATLQGGIDTYQQNVQAFAEANEKLKTVTPGSEDETKLKTQITSLQSQIQNFDLAKTQSQIDEVVKNINQAQGNLTKLQAQGWDPNRPLRLDEVKWTGTLDNYIQSTIISGRPVSALYWPLPMPAWAQISGGPLRPDEVADLTAYITNFRDTAVQMTPKDVHQQFKAPTEGGAAAGSASLLNKSGTVVGVATDTKKLAANDALKGGDAKLGEQKYAAAGCAGCHLAGQVAPKTEGTFTRIQNERLKDPANQGKTAEEYIAESIIHPTAFVAPNFTPIMPTDFGAKLDVQDIKDLIAFLESQK